MRLSAPRQLTCEIAIFALGSAALYTAGQPRLAAIFAVAAIVSRALIARWGREAITYNPSQPSLVGDRGR